MSEEKLYKKAVRSWSMYDWANSAFATTIMAGFMPLYYAFIAGEAGLTDQQVHVGHSPTVRGADDPGKHPVGDPSLHPDCP